MSVTLRSMCWNTTTPIKKRASTQRTMWQRWSGVDAGVCPLRRNLRNYWIPVKWTSSLILMTHPIKCMKWKDRMGMPFIFIFAAIWRWIKFATTISAPIFGRRISTKWNRLLALFLMKEQSNFASITMGANGWVRPADIWETLFDQCPFHRCRQA